MNMENIVEIERLGQVASRISTIVDHFDEAPGDEIKQKLVDCLDDLEDLIDGLQAAAILADPVEGELIPWEQAKRELGY